MNHKLNMFMLTNNNSNTYKKFKLFFARQK